MHLSIVASEMRLAVSGVSGVCSVMKSHLAQISSKSPRSMPTWQEGLVCLDVSTPPPTRRNSRRAKGAPTSRNCSLVITGSYPITCKPMVCAMPATTW